MNSTTKHSKYACDERLNRGRVFRAALLFLLALCLSHGMMQGQAVSGTMVGTVSDPTGAVVSNAQVTVTLTGQSTNYQTVTNDSGNFTQPNLPSGTYNVAITATGFKKVVRENIVVETNTTARVDATLETGAATDTVTVTTAPPQLQTDRADISTTLESKQIADLPLTSGNSFQSLLTTVPGMAPLTFNNSQFFNANNDISTNANGQSTYVNLYQIEGIDDDQRTGIHIILVPPANAIQNVDITTNNFEAEFGRAIGTVVNVTLKSGTNQWHGNVFQNMQNNGVNAKPYFQSARNGRLVYNYSGASAGGPILKDKLFIFGDVLRVSDHEEANTLTNIPFYNVVGNSLSLAGYPGQVYDPNTGDTADCLPGAATPANCGAGRTAFAGNVIPLSNAGLSPISLKVFQQIDALARNPATNQNYQTYINGTTSNNFSANLPFHKDIWSYDIKSDYNISSKDHLSGRFSHQHINILQAPTFGSFLGGPSGGGFEASGIANAYSTGVNYEHTFSPKLFTEFRAGVAHLRNVATQTDYGVNDARTLGIPGNGPNGTNNTATTSGQIAWQVFNFVGNGEGSGNPLIGYSPSLPWVRAESNIDVANNWTKLLGNHQIKAGVDVRRIRDDLLQGNNNAAAGTFYFQENQTSSPSATSKGQANDFASVLFDVPYQVGQDTNSTFPAYRQTWLFFFASDKWQATPKLTLDYGVRWELYPPATPRKPGGFVNYNPSTNNLVEAGVDGNPSNLGMKTNYDLFAPRTGLAYRVNQDLVVRAGYGISYVPFVDNTYAYNYPIKTSTGYNNGPTYGPALNPAGGVVNFVTGIPATPTATFGSNGTLFEAAGSQLLALSNLYVPLNFKNPTVHSWNVVVQQALPHDNSLQLAYVANHGTRISIEQNINIPSVYGESGTYDPLNHAADGVTTTFGKTAGVTQYFYGSSTNYQSLQVQLVRRFHNSLGYTMAYTFGKAQGYVTGGQTGGLFYGFSAPNPHQNYSLLDFDRTNNLSATVTYELPAGKNHKYFSSGIGNYALGGWKVSAVIQGVSGLPFSITGTSPTPGVTQTANQTGPYQVTHGVTRTAQTGSPTWFNPASFSAAPTCAYNAVTKAACPLGTTGRNQFRGPGYFSDNVSLFKSFPIHHDWAVEARLDAFNMTNTPEFANPTSSVTSSNFGKITSTLGSGSGNVNGVGGPRVLQAAVKISF
ncbi:TonB-dependent receptor [Granulicella paludicola]|uniref:TonB-dependent receptor n=1 Tax=Granulicella paludicola TaxID=474951 RepID=UPI0021E076BD|nr:TonB-dependent receptor [Granulicella paludicola]